MLAHTFSACFHALQLVNALQLQHLLEPSNAHLLFPQEH
jgi:hypothetical protein